MRIIHAPVRYCAILTVVFLLIPCTAIAADTSFQRTLDPVSPQPGQTVNVSISLPPSFFGGVVETIPEGFTYEGSSHMAGGTRQSGQTVIFAVTGEDSVTYTIRAPASGCGIIRGKWDDVGTGTKGQIPADVIAVAGSDPSKCSTVPHSPGFSWSGTLVAAVVICMVVHRQVNQ